MRIPLYQVDAFTSQLFRGNPAAICPLERWLPDQTLHAIAAENNLPETAYYVPNGQSFGIRWFTPAVEIDLCGHATLATAYVILEIRRETPGPRVEFDSQSGKLAVERSESLLALDFPARPAAECMIPQGLFEALGAKPTLVLKSRDLMCVFEAEDQIRALSPSMEKLAAIDALACMVTAPGRDCDFVSRFFAPREGVPEDPVTGSAHCTLVPYWSKRLGKTSLHARQISSRGGELWCENRGERVKIAGHAVKFLEGAIEIPV